MRVFPPLFCVVAALFLGSIAALAAESNQSTETEKPYTVLDGKVDKKTFNGWRRYTEVLHAVPRAGRSRQLLCPRSGRTRSST